MNQFIWFVLSVFVLTPFCIYELLRFYTLYNTCTATHYNNERLLNSVTCDVWHQYEFGEKLSVLCKTAQEENLISPQSCAWKHMWAQGEVMRVWNMFTQSHWMLWGTMVPVVIAVVYIAFSSRNERLRDERHEKMQGELYEKTLAMVGNVSGKNETKYITTSAIPTHSHSSSPKGVRPISLIRRTP